MRFRIILCLLVLGIVAAWGVGRATLEQAIDRQSLCGDRRRHVSLLPEDLHLHRLEARLPTAIVAARRRRRFREPTDLSRRARPGLVLRPDCDRTLEATRRAARISLAASIPNLPTVTRANSRCALPMVAMSARLWCARGSLSPMAATDNICRSRTKPKQHGAAPGPGISCARNISASARRPEFYRLSVS